MNVIRLIVAAALLALGPTVSAQEKPAAERLATERPAAADILPKIKKAHPRLLATTDDFARLKELAANPKVAPTLTAVRRQADALLSEPPSKYEIRDGKRLLYVSREVKEHVLSLGLVYHMTADRKYADRLWAEVDAVSKFPDWNPRHFLDTAEMTFAMAIAYDWLFDTWTPAQRATLRGAILKLGLEPALKIYRAPSGGFARMEHNWNQVCNGGILTGALAISEDEPAVAGEILERAIASLPLAMEHFAPDGAWGEGPGYWDYATEYNVYALAALRTAVGTDYGLSAMQGFSTTGDAPLAFTGPLGLTFNYADAKPGFSGAPQLFWLATAFNQPDYAVFQSGYASSKPTALDVLWGAAWMARDPGMSNRPLDRLFRTDHVAYLRSAWDDPKALFVGFKGGDNKVNHGQLDLGSFVIDALGQRWAIDPGPDDYNRPGYFGPNRWLFYRCRAEGNNCFILNPDAEPDQSPMAVGPIDRFYSDAGRGSAVVDLTAAYARHATSARRGLAMLDRKQVLIQDEIKADKPFKYAWFMHTGAKVAIAADGKTATLTQGGQTLTARLVGPANAKFTVTQARPLPTSPPEPPAAVRPMLGKVTDLAEVRKLTVQIDGVSDLQVAVLLEPGPAAAAAPPALTPLSQWPGALR
ncbi:heparinase II/III domain-containing protein [Humisphaera borealis]|uniref:Heparinase II/III family protein n=1 Tax=Humisphaera borealis TaxID=2807512 RepID=A0A7M2WUT7_9BACT|nr:heparinase II/III family protein [Humisphaera borealis]QOV89295.1 heparinase II/III family protein [Humisphaera borealis]